MSRGHERNLSELEFCLPSECADHLASGSADLGIVPIIEVRRQGLEIISDCAIACRGPVRSILLVSKVAPEKIRTLATDAGSRTSVVLTRILLHHIHGANPQLVSMAPDLDAMLAATDAALVIGDAALRLDPETLPYYVQDLGKQWVEWTGLPMVFAVWAGKPDTVRTLSGEGFAAILRASLEYGLSDMDRIVEEESQRRGFTPSVVRDYLTKNVSFDLGPAERQGMAKYLELAVQWSK
jgi:predicted solute-binding protein